MKFDELISPYLGYLKGIGGDDGPTGTASAEGLGTACMREAKGVVCVIMLIAVQTAVLGVTVLPGVLLLVKVGMAVKAVL